MNDSPNLKLVEGLKDASMERVRPYVGRHDRAFRRIRNVSLGLLAVTGLAVGADQIVDFMDSQTFIDTVGAKVGGASLGAAIGAQINIILQSK